VRAGEPGRPPGPRPVGTDKIPATNFVATSIALSARLREDQRSSEESHAMTYYLGVDIGGTFTDCVAVDDDGRIFHAKTPSTHGSSPVTGVLAGLDLLAEEVGVGTGELCAAADRLGHGTTIGTNLIVERKGARVALLATAGHGDALSMMRGNGRTAGVAPDQVFSVHGTDKPEPLVERRHVLEVSERVTAGGGVLAPLDVDRVREQIRALLADENVDAVAIALLWSFRNPAHEQRLRELVNELAPELYVSISSETAPRQGEYERTVATVLNSYVGPASSRYLAELAGALTKTGLERPVLIMQAAGGVVPVEVARAHPVQTIGSGPAGGVAGTASIAAAAGHPNVIATDMGGTSFEVGLIVDGRPLHSSEHVVEQYSFHATQLDVRSIACGGGSIAWVDPHSGALRVGPHSAGSDPGPACYGKGTEPTVTDADVVLGLIDPRTFLGGRMALDAEAARKAIATVADPLGLAVEEAAAGIVHVNNQKAALLIRQRTIEQGLDPRDFVLYVFGGAGPVHAFGFAEELGVSEVVIPLGNGAATLSAYGIAATDIVRTFERQCSLRVPFTAHELASVVSAVECAAAAAMRASGFDPDAVAFERVAVMRYAEQFLHDLPITLPAGPIDNQTTEELAARFDQEYDRLYGEGARSIFQAVEIFGIRAVARVALGFVPAVGGTAAHNGGARTITSDLVRQVYWPDERAWVPTAVHHGHELHHGDRVNGPAVVELPYTTVAVAAGHRLRIDPVGNYVLSIG
jgi:N-methylhydantoinase A